eukprot:1456578-Rhodomonas_salina.3
MDTRCEMRALRWSGVLMDDTGSLESRENGLVLDDPREDSSLARREDRVCVVDLEDVCLRVCAIASGVLGCDLWRGEGGDCGRTTQGAPAAGDRKPRGLQPQAGRIPHRSAHISARIAAHNSARRASPPIITTTTITVRDVSCACCSRPSAADVWRERGQVIAVGADVWRERGQVIAVGDGANDIPMLKLAGLGVAFHAKPKVTCLGFASMTCSVENSGGCARVWSNEGVVERGSDVGMCWVCS